MWRATVLWMLVAAIVLWGLTLAILLPDWRGQRRLRGEFEAQKSAYLAAHPQPQPGAAIPSNPDAADYAAACLPTADGTGKAACAAASDEYKRLHPYKP